VPAPATSLAEVLSAGCIMDGYCRQLLLLQQVVPVQASELPPEERPWLPYAVEARLAEQCAAAS